MCLVVVVVALSSFDAGLFCLLLLFFLTYSDVLRSPGRREAPGVADNLVVPVSWLAMSLLLLFAWFVF